MKLLKIALHVGKLKDRIDLNTEKLKAIHSLMKMEKYKDSQTLKNEFDEIFSKTSEMMCEYEFYKNQFEEIESYIDIKIY